MKETKHTHSANIHICASVLVRESQSLSVSFPPQRRMQRFVALRDVFWKRVWNCSVSLLMVFGMK